jgi:hypothetical protein
MRRICWAPMARPMSNFPQYHAEFTLAASIRFCV